MNDIIKVFVKVKYLVINERFWINWRNIHQFDTATVILSLVRTKSNYKCNISLAFPFDILFKQFYRGLTISDDGEFEMWILRVVCFFVNLKGLWTIIFCLSTKDISKTAFMFSKSKDRRRETGWSMVRKH